VTDRNVGEVFIAPADVIREAFEIGQGGYRRTARLTGGESFGGMRFPCLTIQPAALWS
jgi:hypothetical protein